ncbi:Long-chain-fatty-acid--CoA ligase [compost metagenome]|uniref:Long-chain fatty acid--CoA ligase n=1 Tax=Pseudomonas synxantha TaxID=47883 RepID=A0A5D3GEP1_9PSED|nr:long-chain fatty acid--CoA ligase [Pseudomonas synxantha]TYK57875.1 long-chain fatty acid--CoA ligase [Pseudomonas synxantha]
MYLTQALHKAAREKPTAIASVFQGRRTTFAELITRVAKFAGALQALDVKPGDRVGMLALNSDRYLEYLYGSFWAGAVINPVNTRWNLLEIAYSLNDCQTQVLLVDSAFKHLIAPLRQHCPCLRSVINCGDGEPTADLLDYEALLNNTQPIVDALRCGQDLAAVLYTGGTTGTPKGVMLSHNALVSNALSALAAAPRPLIDTTLHVAPLFHVGALAAVLQGALRGATHIILSQFDSTAVLRAIAEEGVNETFLVPTMIQRILDDPAFTEYDLSSLRNITYGAAPMDPALLHRALHALPGSEFMQIYGMTELGPVTAVLPAYYHTFEGQKLHKLKAAGRPAPNCEVRIVDPEGNELPKGRSGEVVVRSSSVMLGYWNKPEETAQALRDGWMHSGDGGYLDKDGFLYIVDRIKDMIVSGGENIYSNEVENAILSHPDVRMCAVIGIPDEQWGESVHAVIVLQEGKHLDSEHIKQHCKSLIAGYKCPRSIEFREELPLSAAGKLLKYVLREPFWGTQTRRI